MASTRLEVGAQVRPVGPRTTARPPPVVIGPGGAVPDPRALGMPTTAAAPASGSNSPTVPPPRARKLAQTLQGTGAEEMRAMNRPVSANRPVSSPPRRLSGPPGPSPAASKPGRPVAAREEPDEATHYLQRPAMPPAPLPTGDNDADPTRVISRHDLPAQSGRTPLLHLPPVVTQPSARGTNDPDEESTRLIGSQSWPPSDMAMPGPAMPISDPPLVPTVVLKKNAAHRPADAPPLRDIPPAGDLVQAPFVPPEDLDAPPESKGLAFRTVSSAPLRPNVTAQPSVVIVDSLHNDTTAVSNRRAPLLLALGAAWAKHHDKMLLFGAGTLAGIVLFGLGFVLGTSGRSTPAPSPAITSEAKPHISAAPPAPPTTAEAKPAPPAERPVAASAAPPEPPAPATPSATGRSITSLALETPTAAEKRARIRTVAEPRKTAEAPVKTERTAAPTPPPAPAPTTAAKAPEPEPFPEPKAPPPAAAPRKGYVSPIQAPGF